MKMKFIIGLSSLLVTIMLLVSSCSSDNATPPPKFYFKASDTTSSATSIADLFGAAVTISGDGNTLAIGAWAEDSDGSADTDNAADGAGAVYVFKRSTTGGVISWSQVRYVKAPPQIAGDNFGFSVSLSKDGNRLAVGAPGKDIGGVNTNEGAVYVYSAPNYDTPTLVTASDLQNDDRFGESIALSDDGLRLAVGAILEDGGAGDPATSSGAVYVYTDGLGNGTSWTEENILYAPTPQANANLGVSVALNQDGSVLAAGAWREDDLAANDDRGAAYMFVRTAGPTWSAGTQLKASDRADDDRFGVSIALSDDGTRLAIGAPGDFLGMGGFTGAAYVFTCSIPPTCSEEAIITASNSDVDDAFGIAVALSSSGNTLLVGASYEDGSEVDTSATPDNLASNAGAAYRFTRAAGPPATWTQINYIKATNTDAGDSFGTDVAISDNGSRIVVGASGEDSNATGVDGDQTNDTATDAGAAYLWNL